MKDSSVVFCGYKKSFLRTNIYWQPPPPTKYANVQHPSTVYVLDVPQHEFIDIKFVRIGRRVRQMRLSGKWYKN